MDFNNAAAFVLTQAGLSATPLLFAGYGELIAQRAGIINVGIDGTMLMGAIAAYSAAMLVGSSAAAPVAIAAAMIVGILIAALFAIAVVWLRADQIVAGTAINIFAAGASTTIANVLDTIEKHGHTAALARPFSPHFAISIPILGPLLTSFSSQYLLFYFAWPLAIVLLLLMARTRFGLVVRSLGDAPDACHAAGISVRGWRTLLLLGAGALSGLAGAYCSTMRNFAFIPNMTSGRGFLVLALVIFGRWNIAGFIAGTLAFSIIDGLQVYLDTAQSPIPRQLLQMLPYAATLIALALLTRTRAGPIHLGRPWPE